MLGLGIKGKNLGIAVKRQGGRKFNANAKSGFAYAAFPVSERGHNAAPGEGSRGKR